MRKGGGGGGGSDAISDNTAQESNNGAGGGGLELLNSDSSCTFTVTYVGSEREGQEGAEAVLARYKLSKMGGPTQVILDSTKSANQLLKRIPTLNDFPLNPFPSTSPPLPAFNWEKSAVTSALTSYLLTLIQHYPSRVGHARYANVPIGNLGMDVERTVFDVFFARNLRKQRSLLWASETGRPDLGGGGGDGGRLFEEEVSIH